MSLTLAPANNRIQLPGVSKSNLAAVLYAAHCISPLNVSSMPKTANNEELFGLYLQEGTISAGDGQKIAEALTDPRIKPFKSSGQQHLAQWLKRNASTGLSVRESAKRRHLGVK